MNMDQTLYLTMQGAVAAVCWLIVSGGAGLAVFCRTHNDGFLERIFLSGVSITALATAWRIAEAGWVNQGNMLLAMSLAGYAASIAYKYVRRENPHANHV